jgi:hypothetical protein
MDIPNIFLIISKASYMLGLFLIQFNVIKYLLLFIMKSRISWGILDLYYQEFTPKSYELMLLYFILFFLL